MIEKYVIGGALFLPPSSQAIPRVKDALKFRNPDYDKVVAMRKKGKRIPLPPQFIHRCYTLPVGHAWAGGLMAPRHIDVEDLCKDLKFEAVDRMSSPPSAPVRYAVGFKLRDYQQQAVDSLKTFSTGYVVAPCGAGKTSIGMGSIAVVDSKALILVHTKDLAQQWIDRVATQLVNEDGTPVQATLVGDGKFDDSGRVVVALIQSLLRMPFAERYEWAKQFGLCVADECHHLPADTFNTVMCCIPARYRLGLTATPERQDGMEDVMIYHFGMMLKEIKITDLAERRLVLQPLIQFVDTGYSPPGQMEWPDLLTDMSKNESRNSIIIERAMELAAKGRQILILSERVDHCQTLAEVFRQRGVAAAALVGTMTKKARVATLAAADRGELRIVTATTLADEGLDLPSLDTVILTCPTKAMARVQQRIGRVMRPKAGKQDPLVIDLVDSGKAFELLGKKRARLYRSLGCRV